MTNYSEKHFSAPKAQLRGGQAKVLGFCVILALVIEVKAQFVGQEEFSGQLSQAKWFPFVEGQGNISLSNQEFNFTTNSGFGNHEAGLSWVENSVRNSQDWEFQLDVKNTLNLTNSSHYSGVGIYVANARDERDLAYLEFYSTYFNEVGRPVRGFTAGLKNNGVNVHEADTFELPVEAGAVRVKFDSSERSLTFYFHEGSVTDGYFWQYLAKYGIDGDDGVEGDANWLMSFGAEFDVGLYGLVEGTRSSIGQVTADNFTTGSPSLGLHEVDFEFDSSVGAAGDTVELRWFSFDGLDYVVQSSSDLMIWSDMATASGTGTYTVLEVWANFPSTPRYYRIYSRLP